MLMKTDNEQYIFFSTDEQGTKQYGEDENFLFIIGENRKE
jgi:hypothetical protein